MPLEQRHTLLAYGGAPVRWRASGSSGSVAKFDFWGKIQKSGIRNSTTYRLPNSRKSNFATEPVAVPVQAAAVLGPSVAGLAVEATGSQRTLFVVAAVAIGAAWLLLQRVHVDAVTR
jgi:hypothetical protein